MKRFITITIVCLILWWFFWYQPKHNVPAKTENSNDNADKNENSEQSDNEDITDNQSLFKPDFVHIPIFDKVKEPADSFLYFLAEINQNLNQQQTTLKDGYEPSGFIKNNFVLYSQKEILTNGIFKPAQDFDINTYLQNFPENYFDTYVAGYAVFNSVSDINQAENYGVLVGDTSNQQAEVFIPLYMFSEFVNLLNINCLEIYLK
jgi:hypothetical protein